ncbi:hypothetical protein LA080_012908 [Diaporthe eres]|nr:hypothetical protein LA080_012908 [Diaporthe eres]
MYSPEAEVVSSILNDLVYEGMVQVSPESSNATEAQNEERGFVAGRIHLILHLLYRDLHEGLELLAKQRLMFLHGDSVLSQLELEWLVNFLVGGLIFPHMSCPLPGGAAQASANYEPRNVSAHGHHVAKMAGEGNIVTKEAVRSETVGFMFVLWRWLLHVPLVARMARAAAASFPEASTQVAVIPVTSQRQGPAWFNVVHLTS